MLNRSLLLGTTNLIQKLGDPVSLTTRYKLVNDALPGDEEITLKDSFGLVVGAELSLGFENLVVTDVSGNTVKLEDPIEEVHFLDTYLTCSANTVALGIPRFKRISYELLEFVRKVRIPLGVVVNYGSLIQHFSEEFFVVGMDPGDHSVALTLKEINSTVYVYRDAGLVNTQVGQWGGEQTYKLIAEGEKAYFQQDRSYLPPVRDTSRDPGYTVRGDFQAVFSSEINPKIGDSLVVKPLGDVAQFDEYGIVISDDRYKVVGVNFFTHKNFRSVNLNYDFPK